MIRNAPVLESVARGDLCAGCGGCQAVAPNKIRMMLDGPGYLRPVVQAPLSSEEEASIGAICPGLGLTQDAAGRPDHELWGPILTLYSGHATDSALRHNGASGAALSAILVHLLEIKEVDRVVQIAPDLDTPYANRTVISTTPGEVFAAAGSRYAPSAPLAVLSDILELPGRTAFVGKPCDAAALRAIAVRDPRVDEAIPYVLSFFCAGVPALSGAREILKALEVTEQDLAAFRYRGDGWPGQATATRHDGSRSTMSYHESWGKILTKHVQWRCRLCPDGTGGFADVVCADAWHCDDAGYPLFDEAEGQSLILARTERGRALVAAAEAARQIACTPMDAEEIAEMQPGQFGRRVETWARLVAVRVGGRPAPKYRGFHLVTAMFRGGIRRGLRAFLGTLRRTIMRR